MNLFIVGWNLPEAHCSKVLAELRQMTAIYPKLDPETVWQRRSPSGMVYAASMHTAYDAIAPRQYVTEGNDEVVFYSGLPVHSTGKFPAHRAEALSSHWPELTENLEGMFCIVRSHDNPSRLDLLTDIVGMEQVFYFCKEGLWLMSNSVYLIARIVGDVTLDPSAISLFLSSDWVWDDRTLLSNIRVIPGGQVWTWIEGENEPRRQSYYSPSKLAALPHRKFTSSVLKELSDHLTKCVSSLSQGVDNVNCALTGGRDSRLVSSFFMHARLPVKYYTFGEPSGTDAKIAQQIVETFDLNYRLISVTSSDVLERWDDICRQIILQGDGMASIDLIPTVIACLNMQNDQLYVDVGGTGGELAKGFYSRPDLDFFFNRFGINKMKLYLGNSIARNYGGIIRQEAVEITKKHVYSFVKQYTDVGFAPVDIPDVFFLYSRLRRRRGSNKRVYTQYQDFFTPFITRSFLEAVFSMPARQRYSEPLHYNIIRLLSPGLHSLPLDSAPWKSQRASVHLINYYGKRMSNRVRNKMSRIMAMDSQSKKVHKKSHTATDMFDNVGWFKAKREEVREFCLDQKDSLIWDFVNHSLFEKITSADG